jgi:hypothetical protein
MGSHPGRLAVEMGAARHTFVLRAEPGHLGFHFKILKEDRMESIQEFMLRGMRKLERRLETERKKQVREQAALDQERNKFRQKIQALLPEPLRPFIIEIESLDPEVGFLLLIPECMPIRGIFVDSHLFIRESGNELRDNYIDTDLGIEMVVAAAHQQWLENQEQAREAEADLWESDLVIKDAVEHMLTAARDPESQIEAALLNIINAEDTKDPAARLAEAQIATARMLTAIYHTLRQQGQGEELERMVDLYKIPGGS